MILLLRPIMTKQVMAYFKFLSKYPRPLSYAFTHTFFSSFGQTFLIALFIPLMRKEFMLSQGTFSLLYSLASFLAAILAPICGQCLDKWNLKKCSFLCGVLLALSCFTLAHAYWIPVILLGFTLLRLSGQAFMSQIAIVSISRYFDRNRGKALAVATTGHPFSEAILPIFTLSIIHMFGWRAALNIYSITCLLVFLPLIHLLIQKSDSFASFPSLFEQQLFKEKKDIDITNIFPKKDLYAFLPIFLLPPFLLTALFFHQDFLINLKSWSANWLAISFISFAIARVISGWITGLLIDSFSAKHLLHFYLLPLGVGILLLNLGSHYLIYPIYLMFAGISVGASGPIRSSLWAELYGKNNLGKINAKVLPFIMISTAVAPVFLGLLIDLNLNLSIFLQISLLLILLASLLAKVHISKFHQQKN